MFVNVHLWIHILKYYQYQKYNEPNFFIICYAITYIMCLFQSIWVNIAYRKVSKSSLFLIPRQVKDSFTNIWVYPSWLQSSLWARAGFSAYGQLILSENLHWDLLPQPSQCSFLDLHLLPIRKHVQHATPGLLNTFPFASKHIWRGAGCT